MATTAPPGKEVRVLGIGERLDGADGARRGSAGTVRSRRRAGARRLWHTLAWAVFGAGYVGAIVFVATRAGVDARRRAAGARRRLAAVGVHRRDGRRDRIPARLLDGRLAAAGLARGLRRVAHRGGGPAPRPTAVRDGIRLRSRVVRLSGDVAPGARRRVADAAGRRGRRDRRRKRRRQDDAGQAAGEDVRAVVGRDLRRRDAAGADAGRRVARAAGRRVPGFLPLRVPRPPQRRPRRRAADGRRAGGRRRASIGPARATCVARLPSGLETQLGPTWPGGVELSFGQWQKLALARGFMRERAAAAGARRADGGARRGDRARAVRALRRGGARRRPTTAASRSWCRTASRPCAWRA